MQISIYVNVLGLYTTQNTYQMAAILDFNKTATTYIISNQTIGLLGPKNLYVDTKLGIISQFLAELWLKYQLNGSHIGFQDGRLIWHDFW